MKRTLKKGCLFLFVFFFFIKMSAQSPGYMGKRTVGGYGFYINPAFTAAILDYGTNVVNTQHEFYIERAILKGMSLGFSAKLYKSTYNNTNEVEIRSESGDYLSNDRSPTGHYDIKAKNFAFYFKFYKRNFVAPWGKYFLLGFTLNNYQTHYDTTSMYVPVNQYLGYSGGNNIYSYSEFNDFGSTKQSFQYVDIMIGNGNSRIFGNRIVLDYGYNIHVIATTLILIDAFDDRFTTSSNYIEKTSISRVRGINRFNFFVKLGYLF